MDQARLKQPSTHLEPWLVQVSEGCVQVQPAVMASEEDLFQVVADKDVSKLGLVFTSLPPGHVEVKSVSSGSWAAEQVIFPGDVLVQAQGKDLEHVSDEDFRDMTQQRPLTLVFWPSDPEARAERLAEMAEAAKAKAQAQAQAEAQAAARAREAAAAATSARSEPASRPKPEPVLKAEPKPKPKPEPEPKAKPDVEAASGISAGPQSPESRNPPLEPEHPRADPGTTTAAQAEAPTPLPPQSTASLPLPAAAEPAALATPTAPATTPASSAATSTSALSAPPVPATAARPIASVAPEVQQSATELEGRKSREVQERLPESIQNAAGTSPPPEVEPVHDTPQRPANVLAEPRASQVLSGSETRTPECTRVPSQLVSETAPKPGTQPQQVPTQKSSSAGSGRLSNAHASDMIPSDPIPTPVLETASHHSQLEEELAKLQAKLRMAEAERAELQHEAASARGIIKSLRGELKEARHASGGETMHDRSLVRQVEERLQEELDKTRGELAAAMQRSQKAQGSSGQREQLLKTELEELEATMKKVKGDLQRSQQAVRNCESEMMNEAGSLGSVPALRMEQAVVRGLQRQLVEETVNASHKANTNEESEIENVRSELRIEKAAMRSFHRSTGNDVESTVEQAVQQRQDLKQSLVRAENAAVRGLRRRHDEARRMTLQLEDPLVQEANAIRSAIPKEEEMLEFLSERLQNLEEATAAMVNGDVGRDAFQLVAKAQGFEAAETTAARALAEEAKAVAHAEEVRKELHDSDLYAVRVELHRERTLRIRAVDEHAEVARKLAADADPSVSTAPSSQQPAVPKAPAPPDAALLAYPVSQTSHLAPPEEQRTMQQAVAEAASTAFDPPTASGLHGSFCVATGVAYSRKASIICPYLLG